MNKFTLLCLPILQLIPTFICADEIRNNPMEPSPDSVVGDTSFIISSPARRNIYLSNSPVVIELLGRHRESKNNVQSLVRKEKVSKVFTSSTNRHSTTSKEPEIIKLEVPKDQPPVVNRSKSFVFRDITNRASGIELVSQQSDIQKRQKQIELLRQRTSSK